MRAIGVEVVEGGVGELRATIRAGGAEAVAVALLDGSARPLDLVVVGELPSAARLEVEFSFVGSGEPRLAASAGAVAFQVVAGGDGLTVIRGGDVVIYDRGRPVSAWVALTVSPDPVSSATHLGPTAVAHVDAAVIAELGLPVGPVVDAAARASVRTADGGRIVVDVTTPAAGLVVLPMPDYPGWSASVDGEPADIVRVDDAFPGVVVGPGESVVELDYTPTRQGPALVFTLLGVIALVRLARRDRDFAPVGG